MNPISVFIIAILSLIPLAGCVHAQCGSDRDRWEAKILNDGTALDTVPIKTTVVEQNALPPLGKGEWQGKPRHESEKQLYVIDGTITEAGEEGDNDFHLVLSDGGETTVIEIPSPDDCTEITTHKADYRKARTEAETLFGTITGTSIHEVVHKHVRVIGYGFYDLKNHGEGHTESGNGREIHPVLKIEPIP